MKYVGLDVHKMYIYGTVLDERGTVVKEGKFEYTRDGLEKFLHGIDDAKIAIEAGYCWQPVYELLEDMRYYVELSSPVKDAPHSGCEDQDGRKGFRGTCPITHDGLAADILRAS